MKNYLMKFSALFVLVFLSLNPFLFSNQSPKIEITEEFAREAVRACGTLITKINLEPFFPKEKFQFDYLGFFPHFLEDENEMTLFMQGQIFAGDKDPKVMFAINVIKGNSQVVNVYLLALGDNLISPRLFCDMINDPIFKESAKLENLQKISSPNIHIKTDLETKELVLQTWTLFSENEKYEYKVTIKGDGKGGTTYRIKEK